MKLKSKKHYVKQKSYDLIRYQHDRKLIVAYGLRNKKEIGKYVFKLKKYRNLYNLNSENNLSKNKYQSVITKLTRNCLLVQGKTILDLKLQDFMQRRLQTQVFRLGLAQTLSHARQLVTHKHIKVNQEICIRPSRLINNSDIVTSKVKLLGE